ncbi:hypothetical protein LPJ61_002218 [Coemansia biformis]|uniref:AAA-ATPase-like domain-containing protein n=1 Tax=Coemansia biformis TaxID=1286918 RepID=A0A9W7YDH1_9FUNG|nr:hypothetical protein LPJ61_002218 [Coemansia biformis]
MGGFVVDKSLLCKAFLESHCTAPRVCLPRRFGKSFNLSVLERFFNVVTVHDCPDIGAENPDLDEARRRRERLFAGSLLKQNHPEFFDKHFARYPVIRIDFKLVKERARTKYESLCRSYYDLEPAFDNGDDQWKGRGDRASLLFMHLSKFVAAQHNRQYIVLVDEYDKPLLATLGGDWHSEARGEYLRMLVGVFKDNKYLRAGLIVGVYEFHLSDMGSGSNITSVAMTAGRCSKNPASTEDRIESAPGEGGFAALFAFTKQDVEALAQRVRETSAHVCAYTHEQIIDALTQWYCGYDFGFSHWRYNPVAVVSFLDGLMSTSIEEAAQPYWVRTGCPHSTPRLALNHRFDMLILAPRLLRAFDVGGANVAVRATNKMDCSYGGGYSAASGCDVLDVILDTATYPDNMGQIHTMSDLVMFLLHLGYLTMGKGNAVQIPNTEMHWMWRMVQEIAVHGGNDMTTFNIERERLKDDLYNGDVRELQTTLTKIKDEWMSTAHTYDEHVFAAIIRNIIRIRLDGQPVATKEIRDNNADKDPKFNREKELGKGKPDLAIVIGSDGNNRTEDLLVLVEFKHISKAIKDQPKVTVKKGAKKGAKDKSNNGQIKSDEPLRLAMEALEQIVTRGYVAGFSRYRCQLNIGIAIGPDCIGVQQRLWT